MEKIFKRICAYVLTMTVFFGVMPQFSVSAAKKLSVAEWTIEKNGVSQVYVDTEIQKSGRALKVSTEGSVTFSTKVDVKKGETYYLEFYNKASNLGSASVYIQGTGYSLKPIQSTFDWSHHKFTYNYTGEDGEISIMFSVGGKTDAYWLDAPKFKNSAGENLIKNPLFEEKVIQRNTTPSAGATLEEQYYNLLESDSFTTKSLEAVQSAMKTIPVKKAKNIVVDGNGDDWGDYTAMQLPVLSNQRIFYDKSNEEIQKINAVVKIAYNEDRFYIYVEVEDDHHEYVDSSSYWTADSIQFTLSRLSDTYGYEFGAVYNEEEKVGKLYSTAVTAAELNSFEIAAKRVGNITKYEISFPWMIYYGSTMPDDMLFDLLVNSNSGSGRSGCIEIAPLGIAQDKSNVDFPFLQFLSDDKNWYAWIDGDRKPTVNDENEYDIYIVNYGEEKELPITLPDGSEDTVTVGANEGIKYTLLHTFPESGKQNLQIKIDSEELNMEALVMPSAEKVDKYAEIFRKDIADIEKLMKKCDKAGISYDNEQAYKFIIERFIEYMYTDVQNDDYARIDYTIEKLTELAEKAKSNLNAYLSGEKNSVTTPRYIAAGEDEIRGQDIIATVEKDGEQIKQPFTFIGFGHFATAAKDLEHFGELGYNTIQNEIGPNVLLRPRGCNVPHWGFEINGGEDSKAELVSDGTVKITSNTTSTPNVFSSLFQMYYVEPNTKYEIGLSIKSKQAVGLWFTGNNFTDRNFPASVNTDWTEYKGTFTTGENQKYSLFRIVTGGPATECYIDNVYVRKVGSSENLLTNGDFSAEDDGKKWAANSHYFEYIMYALNRAEQYNVGLMLLISPHYLTDGMLKEYPEMDPGTRHNNPGYNVNTEIAREYIEDYLRILIPAVKDFKCIQSITLANEPHFAASGMKSYYQPLWEEYLKNKYQTIENLNDAWCESYTTFEGIAMPEDTSYDTRYYDYLKFNDAQFARWYQFMKDIIREYTDIPVNVKLMNTLGEHDHQGIDRRSKMYYGMNPEPFAEICEISGNDAILYPNWVSAGEEGELEKSFVYDYQTSLREAPVANTEDHIIYDQDSTFNDFYADFTETDLWQGALHGRAISNIWSWERGTGTSVFKGLFLERPDCVAAASEVALDVNRYAEEVSALKNEKRDVAILYSISSRVYQREYLNAVYKSYEAAEYNGKHPLIVNEEQIDKIMNCDALIIPHAVHCTANAVAKIKEFIENGGKVLIFGDDSLSLTENTVEKNDAAAVKYILDNSEIHECTPDGNWLSAPTDNDMCDIVENFLKKNNLQYVRLIDCETGDTTDNVEWMYAAKDGKIYVNINNYNIGEPKKVKIEIGGKVVESSFELRTQTEAGEEIDVQPYTPRLYMIDSDNTFFDIMGHWSEEEVKALANEKIVNGVSSTRFAPNKSISRAEFVTLILNAIGAEASYSETNYTDVSKDDWFGKYVATASRIGLLKEIAAEDVFCPNKPITRAEIMTVLTKAYEYKGKIVSENSGESFSDMNQVDTALKPYVEKAVKMGWVKGDGGKLLPANSSTRAEAAALMGRFLKNL